MNENKFIKILNQDLSTIWQKLYAKLIKRLYKGFSELHKTNKITDDDLCIIDYLHYEVTLILADITLHNDQFKAFNIRYASAVDVAMEKKYILDYATQLGATKRQLLLDRKAFSRWMGHDTMAGRYKRRVAENEQYLVFLLNRQSMLISKFLASTASSKISRVNFATRTLDLLLHYAGDARVRVAALQSLRDIAKALDYSLRRNDDNEIFIKEEQLKFIHKAALEPNLPTWVQVEALNLLAILLPNSIDEVLEKRLSSDYGRDDLFVRYTAVAHFIARLASLHGSPELLNKICSDPSDYVRQKLAFEIKILDVVVGKKALERLLLDESVPAVKAAALLSFTELAIKSGWLDELIILFQKSVSIEKDTYVLRVSLHVSVGVMAALIENKMIDDAQRWRNNIEPLISWLHEESGSLSIRRYAAETRENLWVYAKKWRHDYLQEMQVKLLNVKPEKNIDYDMPNQKEEAFRVLSRFAGKDFGLDIVNVEEQKISLFNKVISIVIPRVLHGKTIGITGLKIKRWQSFRLRLWRVWYEIANPSTDKRQGFSHCVGRQYDGNIQIPSERMAELSQTKVPGEPLFLSSESGYRPYLPLLDLVISSLDMDEKSVPVKIYTSEGITEIYPPENLKLLTKAYWALTRRFSHYAKLRNWREGASSSPAQYLSELKELGFKFKFTTYCDDSGKLYKADAAVTRFFPSILPPALFLTLHQFHDYFFVVYSNTLAQLVIFMFMITVYFIGKHLILGNKVRKTRNNIPLIIGGWGTRGKSGTERIKAALLNAMGFSIISKTTGCEAMFLHSYAYGKLREMFLFRSYDKATIWEQVNVLNIASRLNADVMLWECMALTPSYVRIMQRSWMYDDISTITNTYPDHEDVQGPAGINIPQVMTNFIPENSILVTSEEQMLPILQDAARDLNTKCLTVGWLQAGLITPDIQARFPYEEHPFNIALVLKVAEELGISEAFALKEMADNVVLDLGVLKAYPPAKIMGRKLEFINGMSANERLAALNNWNHTGFGKQNHKDTPNIWTAAVINNRADRISRSQVFASIMVNDISVDRFYIIGTNLDGLMSYLDKAWQDSFGKFSLWIEGGKSPFELLEEQALRICVTTDENVAIRRIGAMFVGISSKLTEEELVKIWHEPNLLKGKIPALYDDDCINHINNMKEEFDEYQSLKAKTDQHKPDINIDAQCRELLWKWFKKRLYFIENSYATGNEIINHIAKNTPPGLFGRIMGMQNIKGAGLGFVYAWQDWESCYLMCKDVLVDDLLQSQKATERLASFQAYNILCQDMGSETIAAMQNSAHNNDEVIKVNLELINNIMVAKLANALGGDTKQATKLDKFIKPILSFLEAILDSLDAVKRRKRADNIYNDLVSERISHDRAMIELQLLNKRQQGGWFCGAL